MFGIGLIPIALGIIVLVFFITYLGEKNVSTFGNSFGEREPFCTKRWLVMSLGIVILIFLFIMWNIGTL